MYGEYIRIAYIYIYINTYIHLLIGPFGPKSSPTANKEWLGLGIDQGISIDLKLIDISIFH